jgi:hypothetical protein
MEIVKTALTIPFSLAKIQHMKHDFTFDLEEDTAEDNRPDLIKQTEYLYFTLSHNLTKEAKNIIWDLLRLTKVYYPKSNHKKQWNMLLVALQGVIDDFENQPSDSGVLKLYGIQKNAEELHELAKD